MSRESDRLGEVGRYFLRLGFIAFGGPAAHIALMRREVVQQRRWTTDQELVDMLGVTNLIPGPNSTELVMHLGAQRAGLRGLWLAGIAFIVPAVAIVTVLAWAYVEFGDTPAGEGIILGIQPFILAVILQAIWGLRAAALKGTETLVIGAGVALLAVAGVDELALVLGAGILLLAIAAIVRAVTRGGRDSLPPLPRQRRRAAVPGPIPALLSGPLAAATVPASYSLGGLFLVFLKIGSVLYGSGYVLMSFMESEFVDQRGWLTRAQLVDAIAVGQFTPGPLFSSAAFAGYVIDGLPGALVAAAGIFLPSFVLVTLTHPLVPRLRGSKWAAPFLDGVNVAALALMVVVTIQLAGEVLDGWYSGGLFVAGSAVLLIWSPNSAWLVLAGIGAGLLHAVAT